MGAVFGPFQIPPPEREARAEAEAERAERREVLDERHPGWDMDPVLAEMSDPWEV